MEPKPYEFHHPLGITRVAPRDTGTGMRLSQVYWSAAGYLLSGDDKSGEYQAARHSFWRWSERDGLMFLVRDDCGTSNGIIDSISAFLVGIFVAQVAQQGFGVSYCLTQRTMSTMSSESSTERRAMGDNLAVQLLTIMMRIPDESVSPTDQRDRGVGRTQHDLL